MIDPARTRAHDAGRCTTLLLTVVLTLAAALALNGNALAATGVPCAPTGLETISTDQESYPPGETVYISGGGYAIACDVEIRITRPDGVVETATVTTDLGGNVLHEYVLPPFPGVLGMYTLEAVGLGGAVLASHTFTDGPEIKSPDLVPGYVTTGGARSHFLLVRNTGDTVHRCIRVTLPAGYTAISVLGSAASQGSFSSSISGQVITFTNSTGIAAATSSGTVVNGWGRFDIQATPPNNGPNGSDWTFRAWGNTACTSNQTSNESVRIVAGTQPTDRRYRAEFVTAGGAPLTAPIATGSNVTFRLRMTKLNDGQSNKISFFSVALPGCLTDISISSAGENSSNGFDWTAETFGKVVRWSDPTSGELDDGHSVTLTFTANTTGCALSGHAFESTGWEDAAGSAGSAPSKLFTTTASATVTFAATNTAPTIARDNATVTVNEGQTATNTGTWSDPDAGQTVTLIASVGTVTQNADGTWSWSYATTDGRDQNQTVTITATDNASTPASSSTAFALAVNNLAPTATFNSPASVNEGSDINISLSSPSDPSSVDTAAGFEYRFSCNNGTTWTAWGSSTSHACATNDNGPRNVKGEIRDKDGGTSTYNAAVTVNNVAPSATFNAPDSVNEGSNIDLSLTDVVDPGSADTHEFRFSCDGGTTWTAWDNSAPACPTTDNGTVEVRGQVRDDDGDAGPIYEATVIVANVAPSATFIAPQSVDEGSNTNLSLTDVLDPGSADTHEFRFSCDGTTWTAWGSGNSHACPTDDNGTKTVKGQVRDDDGGESAEYSASVTVNNVAPSATFNAPASVNEGSNINLSLTDPFDPSSVDTAAGFQYRFSCDDAATWTPWGSDTTHACATDDNGTRNVKGQIRDNDLDASAYSAAVTVNNVAPSATFNAPGSVNEGSNINISLTSPSDPSSVDTAVGFQYAFDCGDGSGYGAYSASNGRSCPTNDNGTRNVGGKIKDKDGGVTEYTAAVNVNNVPPTLTSLTPSSYLVLKDTSVTVTGSYTDPGTGDTFTCIVNWNEPTGAPENVAGGSGSCSAEHAYTAEGTYTVSMKVHDDDGGESNTLKIIITVYDPSAGGFVTGGGWIMSPKGSYAADPDASGRANFGFNSQYKKGASVPTGQTEFQLHFASFNFHSDTYEVLVVSGYKAQYRGTGKVNGVGGYKFVLTAYDGQITGGGGVDRFRIKITRLSDDVVVYDTRIGTSEDMDDADPLALGGGSIVIHKAK